MTDDFIFPADEFNLAYKYMHSNTCNIRQYMQSLINIHLCEIHYHINNLNQNIALLFVYVIKIQRDRGNLRSLLMIPFILVLKPVSQKPAHCCINAVSQLTCPAGALLIMKPTKKEPPSCNTRVIAFE